MAAMDKYGFFADQSIYVAILAKIKAQLHENPSTFATFKQLMLQYRRRARNGSWNEVQFEAETNQLRTTLESLLPHHMREIRIIFISQGLPQQARTRSIVDFLNDLKVQCAAETLDGPLAVLGNSYNVFVKLMQEYLDNSIEYTIFLRRGLDLCDGLSGDSSLQRRFLGQFCTDIESETIMDNVNTAIAITPLLLSLGR